MITYTHIELCFNKEYFIDVGIAIRTGKINHTLRLDELGSRTALANSFLQLPMFVANKQNVIARPKFYFHTFCKACL